FHHCRAGPWKRICGSQPAFLGVVRRRIVCRRWIHGEAIMLLRIARILLLGVVGLTTAAVAQPTPPPSAITRTVIATSKLPGVTEVPLYFGASGVTLPPGETSGLSGASGILYQMLGS